MPEVLLLGGPNLFFTGCRRRGGITDEALGPGRSPSPRAAIPPPSHRARRGALLRLPRCVEIGKDEAEGVAVYQGRDKLRW